MKIIIEVKECTLPRPGIGVTATCEGVCSHKESKVVDLIFKQLQTQIGDNVPHLISEEHRKTLVGGIN